MTTRLWCCLIAAILVAACDDSPTQPTPVNTNVTVIVGADDKTTSGTNVGGTNPGGTNPGGTSGVKISVAGANDGKPIYQIGPGSVFLLSSGDAKMVWCRPDSNCNGAGVNRSLVNAPRPTSEWVQNTYAFFRRSGVIGSTITFSVDGSSVTHTF